MIETAKKWVGYLEHQTNDQLGYYTENIGKGGCTIFSMIIGRVYRHRNFSGLPWCATFVHSVFLEAFGKEKARELLGKPHPGTRVLARRFRRRGCLMDLDYVPTQGDIIFLHNGDGRISHCGIVEKVEDEIVTSIEGNTIDPSGHFEPHRGGAVAVRTRNLNDDAIVAYGKNLM